MSTELTSVEIVNSSVDGTPIGSITPETGEFTSLGAVQSLNVAGVLVVSGSSVTAPTVGASDNSTNVATTAWATRAIADSMPGVIAGNGYIKLPGGLIMQWGAAANGTSGDLSASFTIPFPTGVLQVLVSSLDFGTGATRNLVYITGQSSTGFTASTGSSTIACSWFAIGY